MKAANRAIVIAIAIAIAIACAGALAGLARESTAQVIHPRTAVAHTQGFTVSAGAGRTGLGSIGELVEPLSGPEAFLGVEKGLTSQALFRFQFGYGRAGTNGSATVPRQTTLNWSSVGLAKFLGSAHLRAHPVVEGGVSGYKVGDRRSWRGGAYAGFGVHARLGRTPALLEGGVRLHLFQTRAALTAALGIGWEF